MELRDLMYHEKKWWELHFLWLSCLGSPTAPDIDITPFTVNVLVTILSAFKGRNSLEVSEYPGGSVCLLL